MKKAVLATMIVLFLSHSLVFAGDGPGRCFTCEDGKDGAVGPVGPAGKDGKPGLNGLNGLNGVAGKDGANGKNGVDGVDGKDGVDGVDGKDGAKGDPGDASYAQLERDQKALATMAGVAAGSRIDHAKNGGMAVGVGVSAIDDAEAISIGVGKSWKTSGTIQEYVFDATAFVGTSGSEKATGITAALTAHF